MDFKNCTTLNIGVQIFFFLIFMNERIIIFIAILSDQSVFNSKKVQIWVAVLIYIMLYHSITRYILVNVFIIDKPFLWQLQLLEKCSRINRTYKYYYIFIISFCQRISTYNVVKIYISENYKNINFTMIRKTQIEPGQTEAKDSLWNILFS